MSDNKKKQKKYVTPLLEVIHNESEETMVKLSGWRPEGDKGPGFGIIEEDKNNPMDNDSWGAKENEFLDYGDDFFRD